jgi:N-methylhydantoinase B/oxoprolinase/acetone carboxylase alpha subunit
MPLTNTRNTPIEALERTIPLRVLRYRLRRESGGAGRAPGGEGIRLRAGGVLRMLTPGGGGWGPPPVNHSNGLWK